MRAHRLELSKGGDQDDEVGEPARGGGDRGASSSNLESEELGLVPYEEGVREPEAAGEKEDSRED